MHSSIFNSDRNMLQHGWIKSWSIALVGFTCFLLLLEFNLRETGWEPSLSDSPLLWSRNRENAALLGDKSLIIVGASRSQLGLDLEVMASESDYVPVQLSIDGSSFLPVLKDLAEDERITGNILVSFSASSLAPDESSDRAIEWTSYYNQHYRHKSIEIYRSIDALIDDQITSKLVTRLLGARPMTVLLDWLDTAENMSGNYLMLFPNRERSADYSKVTMPDFYLQRVAHSLNRDYLSDKRSLSNDDLKSYYQQRISGLGNASDDMVTPVTQEINNYLASIQQRGGNVVFIAFPTDKLVYEIMQARYPRQYFWDRITEEHRASIHFEDYAALQRFSLPDGSHLDKRDKAEFTKDLLHIIDDINAFSN